MQHLRFAGQDLSKYIPGFDSSIEGKWVAHNLPGQRGALQEDLGDGTLVTPVRLQFVGPTAYNDYGRIVPELTKTRRGPLAHPLRGTRSSILRSVREEVRFAERGHNAIIVDLVFADAATDEPDQFEPAPAAQGQEALAQLTASEQKAATLKVRVLTLYRLNYTIRQRAAAAEAQVLSYTAAARAYVNLALALYQTGQNLFFSVLNLPSTISGQITGAIQAFAATAQTSRVTYEEAVRRLQALPAAYVAAADAVRAVGTSPADHQPTITAMELSLRASTQLDTAIRASQPVPVETVVTRTPGESIYALVQRVYAGQGKTPAQLRGLVQQILRTNHLRRPDLLPPGTVITRPAS